jgi:hypothetical protein
VNIKRTGSTTWKEWMKADLPSGLREVETDHKIDGRTNSDLNLQIGRVLSQ